MTAPTKLISALALVFALTAACDPFGLPATRALESGVQSMLSSANSFELAGDYTADGTRWTIDMQLTRPAMRHVTVKSSTNQVEAIIIGGELGVGGEPLLSGVRESIDRFAQPATAEVVVVMTAQLGVRSEVMGAVAIAASRALEAPAPDAQAPNAQAAKFPQLSSRSYLVRHGLRVPATHRNGNAG